MLLLNVWKSGMLLWYSFFFFFLNEEYYTLSQLTRYKVDITSTLFTSRKSVIINFLSSGIMQPFWDEILIIETLLQIILLLSEAEFKDQIMSKLRRFHCILETIHIVDQNYRLGFFVSTLLFTLYAFLADNLFYYCLCVINPYFFC